MKKTKLGLKQPSVYQAKWNLMKNKTISYCLVNFLRILFEYLNKLLLYKAIVRN